MNSIYISGKKVPDSQAVFAALVEYTSRRFPMLHVFQWGENHWFVTHLPYSNRGYAHGLDIAWIKKNKWGDLLSEKHVACEATFRHVVQFVHGHRTCFYDWIEDEYRRYFARLWKCSSQDEGVCEPYTIEERNKTFETFLDYAQARRMSKEHLEDDAKFWEDAVADQWSEARKLIRRINK